MRGEYKRADPGRDTWAGEDDEWEFVDDSAYQAYNEHPQHVSFVADRWDSEVTAFLEIDTASR